ncbi:MAG: FAD-binding protein [Acutalibacteraceae bacterium]|jgi:succinate dehydrogenase/fumarate reductase flavoprotein subunit
MNKKTLSVAGRQVPLTAVDTVVIGSGCAGLNAADCLYDNGVRDILLITEGWNMGTSRNTGSDKQTYYKLSLSGDDADSVLEMARTLFEGGGVNGDTALAEAAGSVRGFMKLANLGVPFPTTRLGSYAGYKTDHDPRRRATSAGPLTSKFMTEALEKAVRSKPIPVWDRFTAVRLLTRDNAVVGLIGIDRTSGELAAIACRHVIMATGGPAGLYEASVYPASQTGMTGLALDAGAKAANLQEWQYGLASIGFRWNVSGTYQQVLPRYISVDENGVEREFLPDYFSDPVEALNRVFLKGYQWPFDAAKIAGSSLLDLIIYRETRILGRRVYMDFRRDPTGLRENGFAKLSREAYDYLKNSDALLETPIARLEKMNPPAIALYAAHGIDLHREPLEVAVCAQHHNGGIAVDGDWQSSVRGLFVVGEAAGTFGVCRPGGSALNSTQVGSMRAAEYIACQPSVAVEPADETIAPALAALWKNWNAAGQNAVLAAQRLHWLRENMSRRAAHIRDKADLAALQEKIDAVLADFYRLTSTDENPVALEKTRDAYITAGAVVSAMLCSANAAGSRGSALVLGEGGKALDAPFADWRVVPEDPRYRQTVAVTAKTADGFSTGWQPVRPIPREEDWFERVWADYRVRTAPMETRKEQTV